MVELEYDTKTDVAEILKNLQLVIIKRLVAETENNPTASFVIFLNTQPSKENLHSEFARAITPEEELIPKFEKVQFLNSKMDVRSTTDEICINGVYILEEAVEVIKESRNEKFLEM
jgi:hypothetical protein